MSISNRPLIIPKEAQVIIKEKEQIIEIIGSHKKLVQKIPSQVKLVQEGNKIFTKKAEIAKRKSMEKKICALVGTVNSLIYSALEGVKNGHSVPLVIKGVGYKVLLKAKKLDFSLGKSHIDELTIPENLEVTCPDNSQIIIKGASKEEVGQFAAQIKKLRQRRPYKLKGVYHKDEQIKLKAGKTLNK